MASIRFEAETQRQHPRYQLPLNCEFEGKLCRVADWSVDGFALADVVTDRPVGSHVDVRLLFPFRDFELNLAVSATIQHVRQDLRRVGFQFAGINDQQAGLIRYLLDAYVSGEIVEAGDLLDVAGRSGEAKSRPAFPQQLRHSRVHRAYTTARRLAAVAALAFITIGLMGYVGASIYERAFVVEAETASVAGRLVEIAAPATGQIEFVSQAEQIGTGEPLFAIRPVRGNPVVVEAPCDCLQVDQVRTAGDFAVEGEPILRLIRQNTPIVVAATIARGDLLKVYRRSAAEIQYADGTRIADAEVLSLPGQPDPTGFDLPHDDNLIVLSPGRDLTVSMIGQPVRVRFEPSNSHLLRAFDPRGLREAIAGLFGQATPDVASMHGNEDRVVNIEAEPSSH